MLTREATNEGTKVVLYVCVTLSKSYHRRRVRSGRLSGSCPLFSAAVCALSRQAAPFCRAATTVARRWPAAVVAQEAAAAQVAEEAEVASQQPTRSVEVTKLQVRGAYLRPTRAQTNNYIIN